MMAIITGVRRYLIMVLICISLMTRDVEHLLNMSSGHMYVLLERCLFRSFAYFLIGLFVFLVLSHVSSLYILEIKPLSKVSLANMFSHIVSSLFISMIGFSAMQKLFNLMYLHLFIFFLCFPCPRRSIGKNIVM